MLAETLKGIARQWLGKAIGDHVPCRTVLKLNLIVPDAFAEEHVLSMHMLSLAMIGRVFSESYGPLVVAEDDGGQRDGMG